MGEDFLLSSDTAVRLYEEYARDMPLFDYHCHLSPKEIAENKSYKNITELWLGGDHYKWRAMRSNGVPEAYITGNAPDKEKFLKWAETIPQCIGNPLYHWTHLELKRYFGIHKLLSSETAEEIWESCNAMLQDKAFSAQNLIKRSNVKAICTTDNPVDSLEYHLLLAQNKEFDVKVLPTFRPDPFFNIEKEGFTEWVAKLEAVSGYAIHSLEDLKSALARRLDFFHQAGCRLSDHGLEPVVYQEASETEVGQIFQKVMNGLKPDQTEVNRYKTFILVFLGQQYALRGWVMQLHIGATRNNSLRMFKKIGPDTGFDAINDLPLSEALSGLLNRLDSTDELPKTILYCLNPSDNEVLGTLTGCFQGGGIPGKIQFGSGWWHNDNKDGMERQMTALANLGLLPRFVGMLTDSRSFLSYTRHEYFRRILCNLLGAWVENGEAPSDMKLMGDIVRAICFNNAKDYFGIEM